MDLKKFTVGIVDCYVYDVVKSNCWIIHGLPNYQFTDHNYYKIIKNQDKFTPFINETFMDYVEKAKEEKKKKTILYLVSNMYDVGNEVYYAMEQGMKMDNLNVIISPIRGRLTYVNDMKEDLKKLSFDKNRGITEIIINRPYINYNFFEFDSFLYELNEVGSQYNISKYILGVQLEEENGRGYSQFLKALSLVGPEAKERNKRIRQFEYFEEVRRAARLIGRVGGKIWI